MSVRQEFRRMPDGTVRKFIMRRLTPSNEIIIGDRLISPDVESFEKEYPRYRLVNYDKRNEEQTLEDLGEIVSKMTADQLSELGLSRKRGPKPKPAAAEEVTEEAE